MQPNSCYITKYLATTQHVMVAKLNPTCCHCYLSNPNANQINKISKYSLSFPHLLLFLHIRISLRDPPVAYRLPIAARRPRLVLVQSHCSYFLGRRWSSLVSSIRLDLHRLEEHCLHRDTLVQTIDLHPCSCWLEEGTWACAQLDSM